MQRKAFLQLSDFIVAANEKRSKENVQPMLKMIDYADALNPYMYHCHFLEHKDAGMMGHFSVI